MEQLSELSQALITALESKRRELVPEMCAVVGYSEPDVELLFQAAIDYLAWLGKYSPDSQGLASPMQRDRPIGIRKPWGRCLLFIPANAPIPLAIINVITFAITGNSVTVLASRKVRDFVCKIVTVLNESILRFGGKTAAIFDGTGPEAIKRLRTKGEFDFLYFMGSSKHYEEIAAACAFSGTEYLFEGEGRVSVVLDPELRLERVVQAAASIKASKTFCNGLLCTSPQVVFLDPPHMSLFRKSYSGGEPRLSDSLIEVASCGELPNEEINGESVFILPVAQWNEVIQYLANSRYRLQLSIYSDRPEFVSSVVASTHFARYTVNLEPTFQLPHHPWGGYGKSGSSIPMSLVEKCSRQAILEGAFE